MRNKFEFITYGPPYSVNSSNKTAKKDWQNAVRSAAKLQWHKDGRSGATPIDVDCTVHIKAFYVGQRKDADNIIKPILDAIRVPDSVKQEITEYDKIKSKNPKAKKQPPLKPFHIFEDDNVVTRVVAEAHEHSSDVISGPGVYLDKALSKDVDFVQTVVVWRNE